MSYRDREAEQQKTLKKIKLIFLICFALLILALSALSFFVPTSSWQYAFSLPKIEKRKDGELRIHYLNVGQADSTLIEFPDGKTLLIDGGDTHSDATIMRYLNALKIKKLDYVLLTHTDADHCGSLDEVVKYKGADRVLLPCMTENSTYKTAYKEFLSVLGSEEIEVKTVKRFDQITSSSAQYPYAFTILFPHGVEYDEETESGFSSNELSTIGYLSYGEADALFCGDTTANVLQGLVKEDGLGAFKPRGINLNSIDIMKVPHHGAKDGLTNELVSYFNFRSAVISCGVGNIYGHPHEDLLDHLSTANCQVYRTDLQGTVVATISANGSYKFTTEK
ncbi:MAG: MBL fold metallo-hydrolase [Clostridia bacterium]|nr:MBL fold metallo-hydrolase [Clostridia bacterium]